MAQAAECYACLVAVKTDREALAFAARLCAPHLHALDCEYGVEDAHNVAMRAFVRSHCTHCGGAASSHCSRCKLASFCGQACQRSAWKAHKLVCEPVSSS